MQSPMTGVQAILDQLNQHRSAGGYLLVEQVVALGADGIVVTDPFAVQISKHVVFKGSCRIRGAVNLLSDTAGALTIGSGVTIEGSCTIEAKNGGTVTVGDGADIGVEGGFHIHANVAESSIVLGPRVRLYGGGAIYGKSVLGQGAQILGRIKVVNCILAGGADSSEPNPDLRGAVLKGMGLAENISLQCGEVVRSFGLFTALQTQRQVEFHPYPPHNPPPHPPSHP